MTVDNHHINDLKGTKRTKKRQLFDSKKKNLHPFSRKNMNVPPLAPNAHTLYEEYSISVNSQSARSEKVIYQLHSHLSKSLTIE